MADRVQILKVGPVTGWPGAKKFLYVPFVEPGSPDQMISAPDDTAGLDACRAALPEVSFLCDSWMSPNQHDAVVAEEMSGEMLRARADIALGVRGEASLPPGKEQKFRQLLLANIGPLLIHPALIALCSGGSLRVEVELGGDSEAARSLTADLSACARPPDPLLLSIKQGGAAVDAVLSPPQEPLDFVETAFADAYNLETVPNLTVTEGDLSDAGWSDLYLTIALGFATVTGLDRPVRAAERQFQFVSGMSADVVTRLTFPS